MKEQFTFQNYEIMDLNEHVKKPYICPVCLGNGLVPNGFYNQTSGCWSTTSTTPEICRTCKGTGIVWG